MCAVDGRHLFFPSSPPPPPSSPGASSLVSFSPSLTSPVIHPRCLLPSCHFHSSVFSLSAPPPTSASFVFFFLLFPRFLPPAALILLRQMSVAPSALLPLCFIVHIAHNGGAGCSLEELTTPEMDLRDTLEGLYSILDVVECVIERAHNTVCASLVIIVLATAPSAGRRSERKHFLTDMKLANQPENT